MKYLCLILAGEERPEASGSGVRTARVKPSPMPTFKEARRRMTRLVTDGPFIETKELPGA